MPERTTTLSVVAAVLAGTGLMAAGCDLAVADDCLRAPNRETPAGAHWHYRLDRDGHRKCWYLAGNAHRSGEAQPAKASLSAKPHSLREAERIPPSVADAHAQLPDLAYTEPFMDGPLRFSPEEPVPRRGRAAWNVATSVDSGRAESAVTAPPAEPAPLPLPLASAVDHVAAPPLPADESLTPSLRLMLSLLLVAMGLGAVTGAVVFKRSDPVSARLHGGPFQMRDAAEPEGDLEEMSSEQMVSLALAQDIPLFLLQGRFASN